MDTTLTILDERDDIVTVGDDQGNVSFLHMLFLYILKNTHNIIVKPPTFVPTGVHFINLYCRTSIPENIEEGDDGEFERHTIDVRSYRLQASTPCAFDEHSKKWFTYIA